MRHYVYILKSVRKHTYYIGVTKNVARRLKEHNMKQSRSTSPHAPYDLLRVEGFDRIEEAYARERFLKQKKSSAIIEHDVKSSLDVLAEQEIGIPIQRG